MVVKKIIDEDFTNYKKPSMFICSPRCTMKCGEALCQNSPWLKQPDVKVEIIDIIKRYEENELTKAVVIAGLDPMDSFWGLYSFILMFRSVSDDDIVIYTGYNKDEITDKIELLKKFTNIIIKFGRYIPNQQPHYDEVLGVNLASDNQYAERISES